MIAKREMMRSRKALRRKEKVKVGMKRQRRRKKMTYTKV